MTSKGLIGLRIDLSRNRNESEATILQHIIPSEGPGVNDSKEPEKRPADEAGAPWQPRSPAERRSTFDKRTRDSRNYFKSGGVERRKKRDRRQSEERRDKWLRIDKWRSVAVFDEDQEDIDAQNG